MKYIILFFKLFVTITLFSQTTDTWSNNDFKEIICYKYNFFQGDTLIYRVYSHDSIIVGMEKPLLRIRDEKIRIVCDSVGKKNGYYYLSLMLINYNAIESQDKEKNVQRTNSPWLNRKVFLVIDSLGNRISTNIDKPELYSMSPGGAFTPNLFFSINGFCKTAKESWMVKSLDTLAENGNPFPLLERTLLYRAYEEKDTLGQICQNLTYISTAQGSMILRSPEKQMSVTSIIAGSGNLYISKKDNVPVYQFTNAEQKLRIYTPEDEDGSPAWHYTVSEFFLEYLIPGKKRNLPPIQKPNTKKKNGKKN